jgi:hypothetical protein
VTASPVELITAELLPAGPPPPASDVWAGSPIARLRIVLNSKQAGQITGAIRVSLDGPSREPDVIPVSANIVGRVEVMPSTMLLPLATGSGELLCRGMCRCTAGGKPFALTVEDCPRGLTATVLPGAYATAIRVAVELKPETIPPGTTQMRTIKLQAVVEGQSISVAIPVLCRGVAR